MNHILIFRTHRFGDILQTQPMIQGIRQKYRHAHISFIVDDVYQELVEKSGLVDTVVGIPYSRQFAHVSDKSLTGAQVQTMCRRYMNRLIKRDIDLAINRSFSQFSALFLNILSPRRIVGKQFIQGKGFGFDSVTAEYMQRLLRQRTVNPMHLADVSCRLAEVQPDGPAIRFFPDRRDRQWWTEFRHDYQLDDDPLLIGVQMGANKPFRHWGAKKYAGVINKILLHPIYGNHIQFICFGDASETNLYPELITHITKPDQVINAIGKTTLGQLAAALSACRLLLSGDTGTMHLATAVQTRVVSIFYASAYYEETGPYGNDHLVISANRSCYPCFNPTDCPYELACRDDISVDAVVDGVMRVLQLKEKEHWNHKASNLFRSHIDRHISYSLV